MKITIDTETDSLEDLHNTFSILIKSIEKKGGKIVMQGSEQTQQSQQESERKLDMSNAYVKRAAEQEKLMKTIDLSNLLQSDHGLIKRREEALRKNI
ncbi:hypothetical protein HYX15_03105 [Candidatus Woesearchaeota archaeon]|nr:hypothetical protein [Candidatus Woesearchaeota archaeon]